MPKDLYIKDHGKIRALLYEKYGIEMTDDEFDDVMTETERDIKINRLDLGVVVNTEYLLYVASTYYNIIKRISGDGFGS